MCKKVCFPEKRFDFPEQPKAYLKGITFCLYIITLGNVTHLFEFENILPFRRICTLDVIKHMYIRFRPYTIYFICAN